MVEQERMTVSLHWRDEEGEQQRQVAFVDQIPHELIPRLVEALVLPSTDRAGDKILYELRLGGEQRPALKPKELLSSQHVRFGSDLWLAPRAANPDPQKQRCLLRLPDGTEIVIGPRGQQLTRTWLLKFVELHNPAAFRHEAERFEQGRSAYQFVANSEVHCTVSIADKGYWIVTTQRNDRVTEWAADEDFEPIPVAAPVRLDNGMRLRLGGSEGLELTIILV